MGNFIINADELTKEQAIVLLNLLIFTLGTTTKKDDNMMITQLAALRMAVDALDREVKESVQA